MIRIRLRKAAVAKLEAAFRAADDRKLRDRCQIVLMTHRGRTRVEVARDLACHRKTVERWLNAYLEKGLAGLAPRKAAGPAARIPDALAGDVRQWVIDGPAACGLDRANWTYAELAAHLGRTRGVRVGKSAMAAFGRRHGVGLYRPTYRFLRGDPAKQAKAAADLAALKRGPATASSSW